MTCQLLLLVGIPGSGKSYLAAQLVAAAPSRPLISTDAIRAELFGAEIVQGDWLKVQAVVEQQFRQAVAMIQAGEATEAIYDATNASLDQRRNAIRLARNAGFTEITGLWLDTPLPLCLERNRQRQRQVPEDVILRMHHQLQAVPPAETDGFDRLLHLPE
jgi:predicted kinase